MLFRWGELPYYKRVCGPDADTLGLPGRTTLDGWLARWALYLSVMKRFTDLPLYLQYLCKILFHVVDRNSKLKTTPNVFYCMSFIVKSNRVKEYLSFRIFYLNYNILATREQ